MAQGQRDGVAEVSGGGDGLDALGLVLVILIIALLSLAGYIDWSGTETYQSAWNEAYQVEEGVWP